MDNFFEELKNNLEHRPEPQFEDAAWIAMQQKMQVPTKRRPVAWWWWSLLLLPLVASNFYLYDQMRETKALLSEKQVEVQKDTVFSSKVIYIRDTIYEVGPGINKKGVPTRIVNRPSSYSNMFNLTSEVREYLRDDIFSTELNLGKTNINKLGLMTLNSLSGSRYRSGQDFLSNDEISTYDKSTGENNIRVMSTVFVDPLEISLVERDYLFPLKTNVVINSEKRKKTWEEKWLALSKVVKPKRFSLGAGAGFIYPMGKSLSSQKGYEFGMQSHIDFSNKFKLWVDVSYLRFHIETAQLDGNFGIPNMPLPDDDYVFDKASVDRPNIRYAIGFNYLLNSEKNIQPYFGLGYSVFAPQPYEVEYEYFGPTGEEIIIPRDFSNTKLITNIWLIKSGLQYRLSNDWALLTEGIYQSHWSESRHQVPNTLSLRARLLYTF
jgi:hypothetical protein